MQADIFTFFSPRSAETAKPGDRTTDPDIVMPERYQSSQRVNQSGNQSAIHTPGYILPFKQHSTHSFSCSSHAFFTETVLATNLEHRTRALQARRTDIGRHCSSAETAQPWIEPPTPTSSLRVNSLFQSGNHSTPPYTHLATLVRSVSHKIHSPQMEFDPWYNYTVPQFVFTKQWTIFTHLKSLNPAYISLRAPRSFW